MMDIQLFVYDGIEFTNFEQIKEHEDALVNVCYQFDWKDEAYNAERTDSAMQLMSISTRFLSSMSKKKKKRMGILRNCSN